MSEWVKEMKNKQTDQAVLDAKAYQQLAAENQELREKLAQMEQENLAAQLRELPKRAEQEKEEEHISAPLSKTSKLVISVYAVGIVALILLIVLNALSSNCFLIIFDIIITT